MCNFKKKMLNSQNAGQKHVPHQLMFDKSFIMKMQGNPAFCQKVGKSYESLIGKLAFLRIKDPRLNLTEGLFLDSDLWRFLKKKHKMESKKWHEKQQKQDERNSSQL